MSDVKPENPWVHIVGTLRRTQSRRGEFCPIRVTLSAAFHTALCKTSGAHTITRVGGLPVTIDADQTEDFIFEP